MMKGRSRIFWWPMRSPPRTPTTERYQITEPSHAMAMPMAKPTAAHSPYHRFCASVNWSVLGQFDESVLVAAVMAGIWVTDTLVPSSLNTISLSTCA